MKTVSLSELEERLLEYLSEVEQTGEPLIVTENGQPVWEVRPVAWIHAVTPAEEAV